MQEISDNDIAIIGMSGRFPKARNIEAYWQNLIHGINSITKAEDEDFLAAGIPESIRRHKRYVNASSRLEDARYFDADFFGLSKAEATLLDPQIRLLLQTSWHAFEDAGYDISRLDATVGNFCGMSTNSYLMRILETNALSEVADPLLYRILNEKDFLATWISYKLNLTGPAMTLQTACSTSLLAVHQGCQSLLNGECDLALVGGSTYNSSEQLGYMHVPESIYSKDGVCRPFDKDASGTVSGDGVGAIIIKRAKEAYEDNDHIYALIKGTAVNNDGANKQGYTTPSVDCQRDVILEALSVADIHPDTIGMLEAHGTGTLIGDPIEVTALTEAYREYTHHTQFCAIGSVKGNIGHLDAAAGVASLIKAALCVNKGEIVPNINFSAPNPGLQIGNSPFYISTTHNAWPETFPIRRAGISSLGVGGTNVHIIVEEPPQRQIKEQEKNLPHVVALSALQPQNLKKQKAQLAEYLRQHPDILLEDVAYTSLYGRKMFTSRFSAVCSGKEELIAQLEGSEAEGVYEGTGEPAECVFLFPGQGSQFAGMAAELYEANSAFRKDMDYCFRIVKDLSGIDYKDLIFSGNEAALSKTENTQVALFIVEYCLATALQKAGIQPAALVGHSIGEYVAACLAGSINLDDALKLVYHRGRLMGQMPEGAMLLVRLSESELVPMLNKEVSICVINSSHDIVIGGPLNAIQQQGNIFDINNIKYKKLDVSHAYHTSMMQGVANEFEEILTGINFSVPEKPIFSTYTGTLTDPEQWCTPQYWVDQILHPVKFMQAVKNVREYLSNPVFVEVGPGNGLSSFIKAIFANQVSAVNLLPRSESKDNSLLSFSKAAAQLFAKGIRLTLPSEQPGKRISIPGYQFSKHYHWKPALNIHYNDFQEIKDAYHQKQEKFRPERIKATLEIQINDEGSIPLNLIDAMQSLHTQYIEGIKKLLEGKEDNLLTDVQILYNDCITEKDNQEGINQTQHNGRPVSNIFIAPETETEKAIAGYWEVVLGYSPAGILDNYFEAGGNSLLATKLMTQLSDKFNIELTFKELSEAFNIKDLSSLVDKKLNTLALVEMMEDDSDDTNYMEL